MREMVLSIAFFEDGKNKAEGVLMSVSMLFDWQHHLLFDVFDISYYSLLKCNYLTFLT
jgi:hypothetical protein